MVPKRARRLTAVVSGAAMAGEAGGDGRPSAWELDLTSGRRPGGREIDPEISRLS